MVLCLTGFSCSGKTSVARYLADHYNYSVISVRNISHALAVENGFSRTREWLSNTSIEQYLSECRKYILSIINNRQNFIIDDLFDIQLWNGVVLYDSILVSFNLDKSIRIKRIFQREKLKSMDDAENELMFLDTWKERFGILEVISSAGFNVDTTNKQIAEIAETLLSIVEKNREV